MRVWKTSWKTTHFSGTRRLPRELCSFSLVCYIMLFYLYLEGMCVRFVLLLLAHANIQDSGHLTLSLPQYSSPFIVNASALFQNKIFASYLTVCSVIQRQTR